MAQRGRPRKQIEVPEPIESPDLLSYGEEKIRDELAHQRSLGYSAITDAGYIEHELVRGACAYLVSILEMSGAGFWPFHPDSFTPKDEERNLVRAAALIAARLNVINFNRTINDN